MSGPQRERVVLSIDGGGIRGIIPAMVLHHLETRTGLPTQQLFDMVAGTSTGGIIGLGLSLPSAEHSVQPRFSARELANLYAQRGEGIFKKSWWRRLRSLGGLFNETYNAAALEQTLSDYFGETTLGELRLPAMVTAYDIEQRRTVFLKSFKPEHHGVRCTEAARATSAAPTYFEPADTALAQQSHALIDGGVFINSPVVSAYAEALKLFPNDHITVVSLGTGELIRPISRQKARRWGSAGWVLPLLDCMFDGVAKAADHQMQLFLGNQYQRFQLSLDHASDDMDDASPQNIAALFKTAELLIQREHDRFETLIHQLKALAEQRQRLRSEMPPAVL